MLTKLLNVHYYIRGSGGKIEGQIQHHYRSYIEDLLCHESYV